ncbi:hypothetical protein HUZ36_11940 [Pseudoalteromonas sp. McH1-7]|uniref:Uncharacterized protein n=1 Tax=Pseudoalteromonas peptidolytica F12-50-A1 TaxID=1315280 RepID=A0A8I0MYA2_9GAMM|nr:MULTISPECIES: hypothetical protein [Pseudoalteromonas]MBE0347723.1 hypothetical protein [Pseudoalteromonas peptidolytica F12-50-A1]NLR16102.1 hypothetical protein [Pseudoalteromonas peptidolytica]NUZ11488.1 hypothetical protein [Pseudoalteromonas sp. McH1-7]GEK08403.1 hypothetical protein PPE03_06520 [Pseudoalteromonas peptidolytica]
MKYWQVAVAIFLGLIIALFTLKYANNSWQPLQPSLSREIQADLLPAEFPTELRAKKDTSQPTSSKKDDTFTIAPIHPPQYLPPINNATKNELQYQGDLTDPEAYQAYLDDKEVQLKQAYIAAVDSKVEQLDALLTRGVQAGLPEAQLQEARDKISALQHMQNTLRKELSDN